MICLWINPHCKAHLKDHKWTNSAIEVAHKAVYIKKSDISQMKWEYITWIQICSQMSSSKIRARKTTRDSRGKISATSHTRKSWDRQTDMVLNLEVASSSPTHQSMTRTTCTSLSKLRQLLQFFQSIILRAMRTFWHLIYILRRCRQINMRMQWWWRRRQFLHSRPRTIKKILISAATMPSFQESTQTRGWLIGRKNSKNC